MSSFNFQDFLSNIQARRKSLLSSYKTQQSQSSQSATKSDTSQKMQSARERILKQVQEKFTAKKQETLFPEAQDKEPVLKFNPKEEMCVVSYGILTPEDKIQEEEPQQEEKTQEEEQEPVKEIDYKEICVLSYGIMLKDDFEEIDKQDNFSSELKMACTNYGIVCPLDSENNNFMI